MNSVRTGSSAAVALVVALPLVLEITSRPVASQPAAMPARAADPPEFAALRAAFLAGKPDDLARAGDRLSARRLAEALAGPDRELALAAASAAPAAADAVWLLAPLGELARSADRPLAAAAARAAGHIAVALDTDAVLAGDVPPDWMRARLAEYRAQAADAGRWADVRVSSLEVAAHLVGALGDRARPEDAAHDLAATLADPDPEIRRAAVELAETPLRAESLRLIAGRAGSDDDAAVAAAAAQAACEGLVFGDPAGPVLAALGPRGRARVRALADGDLSDGAREAMTACLEAAEKEKRQK